MSTYWWENAIFDKTFFWSFKIEMSKMWLTCKVKSYRCLKLHSTIFQFQFWPSVGNRKAKRWPPTCRNVLTSFIIYIYTLMVIHTDCINRCKSNYLLYDHGRSYPCWKILNINLFTRVICIFLICILF
jgi:hypothetical protein